MDVKVYDIELTTVILNMLELGRQLFLFWFQQLRFSTIALITFASQTLPMKTAFAYLRYLCFCLALPEDTSIKSEACNDVTFLRQFYH